MNVLLIALALLFVLPAPASVGIIGGADGPTRIFVSGTSIGGADGTAEAFASNAEEDASLAIIDGSTEVFVSETDGTDALTIIGGTDGPTRVFVSGGFRLLPILCGFLGILFANAGR